ncbi:Regulatory protein leu3 [Lithohypha guttulata]|nr:Regulatory protein leu3 [Lithohypha guttulata]
MVRSQSPPSETRKRSRIACVRVVRPRRANKRDKVHELEDNVQLLRSIVERQQGNDRQYGSPRQPSTIGASQRNNNTISDKRSQHVNSVLPASNARRDLGSCQPFPELSSEENRSIGDITLSREEIDGLFAIYSEQFHSYFPILDPEKKPTQYYDASKSLFWSIISVALRSYKQELLDDVGSVLSTLVWTEIGSPQKNLAGVVTSGIADIQALLLLATWPLSNIRLWSDRSLIMSNLAMTSAMYLGLHRPGFNFEYESNPLPLNEKSSNERSTAWVACYCICISLALESGHLPLAPTVDWLTNRVCRPRPEICVPEELRYFVVIQKSPNEAFQALAQLNDNPALIGQDALFFARMAHYEKVLTDIDAMYGIEMSLLNRVRSQGSVLHLQLLYLLSNFDLEETKQGILRAYRTSTTLIQNLIAEETINTFLAGAPFTVLRLLLRAAFTIAKVWFSNLGNHIDRTSGKILYDASALLVRQMSHLKTKSDKANRAGTVMNMIWKHMAKKPDLMRQPPSLRIRSRMGASLQYDCLMHYRDAAQEAAGQAETASLSDIGDKSNAAPMRPNYTDINHEQSSLPSYEAFLDTDLSWLDDLVNPLT